MCVLYDAKDDNEEDEDVQEENEAIETSKPSEQKEELASETPQKIVSNQKNYKFTLAGFSAAQHDEATKMVARLTKKGFSAQVNEIPSKTSKGKIITWYQVIANVVSGQEDLEVTSQEIAKVAYVNKKKYQNR